jgi:hypothetical protein
MNQRIQELAEQSGAGWDDKYHWYVGNEQIKKFAEAIIRECADVCMKEIDTGWVMAPKSPWMAKQILEHFGIEQ